MKKIAEYTLLGLLVFAGIIFLKSAYDAFVGTRSSGVSPLRVLGDKIGLLEVNGVILQSESIVEVLEEYRDDSSIKAILVRINSPGGGVAASQEIYESLLACRAAGKIVVASMSSTAASGGYYIACAADTIVANPGTTTGSIGVIISLADYSGLFSKLGLKYNTIKSGEFKDIGSSDRPMKSKERKVLQAFVDDAYQQFVAVVVEARNLTEKRVLALADGRIYTGRQAHEEGLVDVLGTYDDAVELTSEMAGITGDPHIVKPARKKTSVFDLLFLDVDEKLDMLQNSPALRYQLTF